MRSLLFFLLMSLGAAVFCHGQDTSSRVTIDKIYIEGNSITRRSVILREIGMKEGDMIPADSLEALVQRNKLRLFNLQLFNEVDQHTERSGNKVDWYIRVRERWPVIPTITLQYADQNFNTWWVKEHHDLRRIMAGLTLTDKNFRGNLETLAVTVQGGYTQELSIAYVRPYANKGQTNGLGFVAGIAQSRQTYYNNDSCRLLYAGVYTGPVVLRQAEGGLAYIYRPAYASRHIFQLTYKDYSVSDTIVQLNHDYYKNGSRRAQFAELFYRYEYNGVDNWNYSLEGQKVVVRAVVRKGFTGLDFQSYVNVEAGWFRNIAPAWYFSGVFRGRLEYPQDQPYFFRGGLGTQTDYVRGYEYYVIDGYNYGLVRFDLKRELFNRSYSLPIKYFTVLPLRIYPKLFVDAGYINGSVANNNFLANRLLYSVGAGIDIVSLYDIKIRVELAWNHLNQNGLYLHFNSE